MGAGVIPEVHGSWRSIFDRGRADADNGKGNANGVGGTGSAVLYTPTTQAIIDAGAQVNAYSLNVQAQAQTKNITIGVAGGTAQKNSVNGAVTYVSMDDTTTAQIAVGAAIATTGPVIIYADDNPLNVNVAGGVSIGTSVGVGVTVGINNITRNTEALIGNQNLPLGGGSFTPDTGVNAAQGTIDLGYVDGFANGDQVIYSSNGDDEIQGLSDGGTYYVGVVNPTTITLGRTPQEALGAAEAAQGLLYTAPTFDHTALGSDEETIDLGYNDGFVTGDAVQYYPGTGGNLFGLTTGTTYYVIAVDATHVKLASTAQDAQNGAAITLSGSTAGSGSSLRLALDATGNTGVRDSIGRVFSPAGSQQLSNNATGGTFTLTVTVNGTPETTAAINYDADAADLQAALDDLQGVSAQVVNAGPDAWIISGAVVAVTDSLSGGHSTLQSYTGAVINTYNSINVGYADGFSAGQAVYYSAGNDPVIGGLTNNTVYYVVPDVSSPDAFQLALTSADALLPAPKIIAVTPTATSGISSGFGAIFDPQSAESSSSPTQLDLGYDDGFTTGQAVIYSAGGGSAIGGLTNGATYYVTVVNNSTVELSTDPTDLAGTMITLDTSKSSGTQHSLYAPIDPKAAVTGGDTTTVSTINLGYNAGFVTGDQVYYNDGGGNNIGGLANENAYYVIVVTAGTSSTPEIIRLASTLANAMSGAYIDLDATTASGLQALAKPFQAEPTVVGNEIRLPDANIYQNGQAVVYHDGGGTPIGGLADDTEYYVNVIDSTHITLSLTPGGPALMLNAAVATGTDHYLSAPSTSPGSLDTGSTPAISTTPAVVNPTVVKATNEGVFVTATLAAAGVGNPSQTSSGGGSNSSSSSSTSSSSSNGQQAAGGQNFGVAASGSVSYNFVNDHTYAYISQFTLSNVAGLEVTANDSPLIVSVSGGAAVSTRSGSALGLAGAVTVNIVETTTHAAVQGSSMTGVTGAASVTATDSAHIISIAAGLAGVRQGYAIAGSVAYNTITADTEAYVTGGGPITAGSLSIMATDASFIITVAGSLAYGGTLGFGAGIAYNDVNPTVKAYLSDADVTVTGAVTVEAENEVFITAVAAGIAVALAKPPADDPDAKPKGFAIAIGLAIDTITADVSAYVAGDGTDTLSAGSLSVTANDDYSKIVAVAGGVSVGVSKGEESGAAAGAGGAALAFNNIDNSISAYLDNITVTAPGNVSVTSQSSADIGAYAIGGAVAGAQGGGSGGSSALAGAGAVTINTIDKDVLASIKDGSSVTTTGSGTVTVSATDQSTINAVAGGIALAGSVGSGGGESGTAVSIGLTVAGLPSRTRPREVWAESRQLSTNPRSMPAATSM